MKFIIGKHLSGKEPCPEERRAVPADKAVDADLVLSFSSRSLGRR